ncbi:hypothetical protein Tco_1140032, partial [Tanacetum coccineum]
MRYPDTEDLEPLNGHEFPEVLTEKASFHMPLSYQSHSVSIMSAQSSPVHLFTPQVILLFEEYTPLVTYPEEVEETLGTPMEVEPLEETQLEDLGLNTCNYDIPLCSREVPIFDELEPQPQPLPNCLSLYASLGKERGPKPPIKPHRPDSFRIK